MKKIMAFLIGILLAVCCMSCGKEKEYTEKELTKMIDKILSKPQFTEKEWKRLDMLLSHIKNRCASQPEICEFTEYINSSRSYKIQICIRHRDNAVQTKNWRLLELLARNHLLQFNDYIKRLKSLNYSDDEILKFMALPNQKFNSISLFNIQDVGMVKLVAPRLTEKDREYLMDRFWDVFYLSGLIDSNKALLECERHFRVENIDLLNELLRLKRQSSKVWTLY